MLGAFYLSSDVPDILGGVAEFAASNTGTETEVADGDGIIFEGIGKVITTFGHGTDEDTDTLVWVEILHVLSDTNDLCVERESHFPTVWWEVIRDGILDHFEQLLLRID